LLRVNLLFFKESKVGNGCSKWSVEVKVGMRSGTLIYTQRRSYGRFKRSRDAIEVRERREKEIRVNGVRDGKR
jgi:hypothetical protein